MTGATGQDQRRAIAALFGGARESLLRAAYMDAIRAWHAEEPGAERFVLHGPVGRHLVASLVRASATPDSHSDIDVNWLGKSLSEPELRAFCDCNWWLLRAGIAVPVSYFENEPAQMRLTGAGRRIVAAWPDHPLADAFNERLLARCPGLPESIVTLFADARACLDHGLSRPALVLLGVAFEEAILSVALRLATAGKLVNTSDGSIQAMAAWKRIELLREHLEKLPYKQRDHAAIAACRFADELRHRRNDAAHTHPTHPFEDSGEIEEFVVSAGRQLPALWAVS